MIAKAFLHFVSGIFFLGKLWSAIDHFFPSLVTVQEQSGQLRLI